MFDISNHKIVKNLKYLALYSALNFFDNNDNLYKREINGWNIKIDSNNNQVSINDNKIFFLRDIKSFIFFECIVRLLESGFSYNELILDINSLIIYINKYKIIIFDKEFDNKFLESDFEIYYFSKLSAGLLEYKSFILKNNKIEKCFFDSNKKIIFNSEIDNFNEINENFVIENSRLVKVLCSSAKIIIPEGVKYIESMCFWDNQIIEEVVLPESLISLGGDSFYNCKKLKKVILPRNLKFIGNNPFAGCPLLELENKSVHFIYEDEILYDSNMETIIYCSILSNKTIVKIKEGIKKIGKHAFYLCDKIEKIFLPKSLCKMENNPFSGCSTLSLINESPFFYLENDVVYDAQKKKLLFALNKINCDELQILNSVEIIGRNSFWNCKRIKKVILPKDLLEIGYNPFVGCENISFISQNKNYIVEDDILYNSDKTKLICFPSWKAKGCISVLESVIELERGSFSGCKNLELINLRNVNKIGKSAFSNCTSLKEIYLSDFVFYVGEWAFSYCSNLEKISIFEKTYIDNFAFSNTNPIVNIRKSNSNYLINSENIFTLKSMQFNYKEKIDSILIDPPYNSNINYIKYKDSFDKDEYYLFMKERILLAYELLSKKGFLVINLDSCEVKRIQKMCNEIFELGDVRVCRWRKQNPYFDVNREILNKNKKIELYEYILICSKSQKSKLNFIYQPYISNNKIQERKSTVPNIFDFFGTTSSAKDEIKDIFGDRNFFSTPKPIKLMKELIRATTSKNSIVLDFFGGSGTTACAVFELNYESKECRKVILITNNENNIFEKVTKIRVSNFSKKYNEKLNIM